MGMTKIIMPGSYDFGCASTQIVKAASRGLHGHDLGMFIKRAGLNMADAMSKISFAPGEVPIHLIAIGATEYYGPNRNGDGFTESCCRKYHDTFVKHARWYRNHANKDPKKSFGVIKYSAYNDSMHRLELIVALNGTKEAAKRNGGLLADRELEKIASGKEDWGVSMACKVAYDVCSGCGNKAKTRDDYCLGLDEGGTCKYGGAKYNLCKVAEDGHILHVDNPHPTWFDISDVFRPADRIAYVLGPMKKAASGLYIPGGAELAEGLGVSAPFELEITGISDRKIREQIKIARLLADIENTYATSNEKRATVLSGVQTRVDGVKGLGRDGKKRASVLKAMAQKKIAMSVTDFVQFVHDCDRGRAEKIAGQVTPHLSRVFNNLCSNPAQLADDLAQNPFRPSDAEPSNALQMWAEKQASAGSLDPQRVQQRSWIHTIRETPEFKFRGTKTADSDAHAGLARAYGLYKLAFMYEIKDVDPNFDLTADLIVRHNHVS
jgi:hypothetical protein